MATPEPPRANPEHTTAGPRGLGTLTIAYLASFRRKGALQLGVYMVAQSIRPISALADAITTSLTLLGAGGLMGTPVMNLNAQFATAFRSCWSCWLLKAGLKPACSASGGRMA
jgi:hypothetical protein